MRRPLVGAVRLQRRRVAVPGGTVVVFVLSVFAMLRAEFTSMRFGWGLGLSLPFWARRVTDEDEMGEERAMEQQASAATEARQRLIGLITGVEQVSRAIERAASGEGAVGPQTTAGDRTVIPLIETFAQGGFGGGTGGAAQGDGGGGGGGGGTGRSRTIAIAVVGPEGVQIRPVVDVTGLALPAVGAIAALLVRSARRRRRG
jgi:uncharacterized spore protein YtfJ